MKTHLLIVAREQPSLYSYLARDFALDEDVAVIIDRRHAERRRGGAGAPDDRRRTSRRRHPDLCERLATVGFAVVPAAGPMPTPCG